MSLPRLAWRRASAHIPAVLAAIGALGLSAPAQGAIVPGASSRLVQVTADIGDGALSDGATSALPGLFDEERTVQGFQPDPPLRLARGVARQTSEFGAGSISAGGQAEIELALGAATLAPTQASASGRSSFVLEFTLDVLSSYVLTGFVDTQAVVIGGAALPMLENAVLLESLDTSTTLFQTLTDDEGFSLAGSLEPGAYRLSGFADAQGLQPSGATILNVEGLSRFSFDFVVTPGVVPVPEPPAAALLAAAMLAASMASRRSARVPHAVAS